LAFGILHLVEYSKRIKYKRVSEIVAGLSTFPKRTFVHCTAFELNDVMTSISLVRLWPCTANIYSEITVKTHVKTVKLNYSFFTVTWTSILPYIVQCRSVDSSLLNTLHLEQQSNVENTVKNCKLDYSYSTVLCTFLSCVPYLQCGQSYTFWCHPS
jgi:hypothetical protein